MADDKSTISLPTELINEKTFYTLSGASAAVWLICWVINYVAVDVAWLNYKTYRLIAIILSEALAIFIMYKTKKKEGMKWLFAFLNGLLIFINASGLNTMTSSYVFNPSPNTATKKDSSSAIQSIKEKQFHAGLFPLPRMISWWPDEELITQNRVLAAENNTLDSANAQLKTLLQSSEEERSARLLRQQDSLQIIINSLSTQLADKQKQVDDLIASSNSSDNTLRQQLADCIRDRDRKNDELTACQTANTRLTRSNRELQNKLNVCNAELSKSRNAQTLTELLKQVCEKSKMTIPRRPAGTRPSQDELLRQQNFYRRLNLPAFCNSFNLWLNPVE
jgi:hypothetical protein